MRGFLVSIKCAFGINDNFIKMKLITAYIVLKVLSLVATAVFGAELGRVTPFNFNSNNYNVRVTAETSSGRYKPVADNTGRYNPAADNSGRYVPDNSGAYKYLIFLYISNYFIILFYKYIF